MVGVGWRFRETEDAVPHPPFVGVWLGAGADEPRCREAVKVDRRTLTPTALRSVLPEAPK